MKANPHSIFILLLFATGFAAVVALSAVGWEYYLTPFADRPFSVEYSTLKPSGPCGHGLGMVGGLLIIVGVAAYSSRKRFRTLSRAGRLSRWLEVHIFLCLLGPILVLYHTTFKIGGVAAITFWTMLSVVLSGFIGRFLYALIPHNMEGKQLSEQELAAEFSGLGNILSGDPVGSRLITSIDDAFRAADDNRGRNGVWSALFRLERVKRRARREIRRIIGGAHVDRHVARRLRSAAIRRVSLRQQSLLLRQVDRLFFYWHVVHLPFTIIMFITLAMHITVVVLLGYRWFL